MTQRLPYVHFRQRTRKFLGVVLMICCAACAGALFPLFTQPQNAIALACGIGPGPTMLANTNPAMIYPITKSAASNPSGFAFASYYTAGQPITFDEDLSTDPAAPAKNTLQFRWDFGDGTGYTYSTTPTHTYAKAGVYLITSYLNSGGWTQFDTAQIHVQPSSFPNPPIAKASLNTTVIGPNEEIFFSSAGSHSQDGSALTYLWNFNDGSTSTGPTAKHIFPGQAGKWVVALIVTDGRGARSVAVVNIQIVNALPTAAVSASLTSVGTGGSVTFDASQSTPPNDPPNDQLVKYAWNFGDGTPAVTTQAPTVTHTFNRAGTFTVTVQAIDQQGAAGSTTISITVVAVGDDAGGLPSWPKFGGLGLLVLALLVGSYLFYVNQRNRAALIRQREEALELARSRRVRQNQYSQYGQSGRTQPRPPNSSRNTAAGGGSQQRTLRNSQGSQGPRQPRPPTQGH